MRRFHSGCWTGMVHEDIFIVQGRLKMGPKHVVDVGDALWDIFEKSHFWSKMTSKERPL